MLDQLVNSVFDLLKFSSVSAEYRENVFGTFARLKNSPSFSAANSKSRRHFFSDSSDGEGPLACEPVKTGSLFDTIVAAGTETLTERRGIGHWCNKSEADTRSGRGLAAIRAFDIEFKKLLHPGETNLETVLIQCAEKKARSISRKRPGLSH